MSTNRGIFSLLWVPCVVFGAVTHLAGTISGHGHKKRGGVGELSASLDVLQQQKIPISRGCQCPSPPAFPIGQPSCQQHKLRDYSPGTFNEIRSDQIRLGGSVCSSTANRRMGRCQQLGSHLQLLCSALSVCLSVCLTPERDKRQTLFYGVQQHVRLHPAPVAENTHTHTRRV